MLFGYDWARAHAALNDFPTALFLVSVLFDLLGTINKRDSLKAAGFWTLIAGVIGTGGAVLAGELASDRVEHSERAHAIMETHETLAIIVLVLFALLALWRIFRRGVLGPREQPVALTAGVIGVALMVYTAKLGGSLMFDHGVGITSSTMESIQQERAHGHHHHDGENAAPPDTMRMTPDTGAARQLPRPDSAKH